MHLKIAYFPLNNLALYKTKEHLTVNNLWSCISYLTAESKEVDLAQAELQKTFSLTMVSYVT